jgi:hypothetical protein
MSSFICQKVIDKFLSNYWRFKWLACVGLKAMHFMAAKPPNSFSNLKEKHQLLVAQTSICAQFTK